MPSGAAAGDMIVVAIAHSLGFEDPVPTGWGWSRNHLVANSGTWAGGTGYRYVSLFRREYDGVWTMPTWSIYTVSGGHVGCCQWAGAIALRTSGPTFEWDTLDYSSAGTDISNGTGLSAAMGSITTTPGGLLVIATARNDNVTISSPGLTQTGATFGTITERCDGGTTLGYDVSGSVHTVPVTTGATGALTFTGTLSGSSMGGALAMHITETETGPPSGDAGTGNYTWSGAAAGSTPRKGTASGAYTWAGTATGKSQRTASAGTSAYTWAGAATGKRAPKGTAAGAYQWETGSVNAGYTWAGTATGDTPETAPTGTGQYSWHATVVGYSQRTGTAAPTYTWAAAVTGKRTPKSQGAPTIYTWASTMVGSKPVKGQTTGTYTWAASDALGHQTGNGVATGTYHYTGLATGLFTPAPSTGTIGWYAEGYD